MILLLMWFGGRHMINENCRLKKQNEVLTNQIDKFGSKDANKDNTKSSKKGKDTDEIKV